MDGILAPGDTVEVVDGGSCRIERLLGAGGQGEVYRAQWSGAPVAVKWYYEDRATPLQRDILQRLIRSGAPNERFLWPSALVQRQGVRAFGYVMPLREERYGNIADLLVRRLTPSFRALVAAGVHLADAFYRLHGMGWCYRDISHNNVFFDPVTGEVLVCDNDNVGPVDQPSGIGGTMRYMAPELVISDRPQPSAETDRYSLAVLLFTILMNHHPLDGEREVRIHCFNEAAMVQLYGHEPLFIWDPDNLDNRPNKDYQNNAIIFWSIYPKFLKDMFVQAFTAGMRDPRQRVTEGRWLKTLSRLHGSIVHCPSCRSQSFYHPLDAAFAGVCWKCGEKIPSPARLKLGDTVVMLEEGAELYPHHLDPAAGYEFNAPIARVVSNPQDPSRLGLKNLGREQWTVMSPQGETRGLDPGRTIQLSTGLTLHLGTVQGLVRL